MKPLPERLRDRCVTRGIGHDIFGERTAAMMLEAADSVDQLSAKLAAAEKRTEKLRTAALLRLRYGHNDTCGSQLGEYPCSCGNDELGAAIAALATDETGKGGGR